MCSSACVPNGGVGRAGDDVAFVVLEAEYGARVAGERARELEVWPPPDADRVVALPAYDLLLVVLQAVDALRHIRAALQTLVLGTTLKPTLLEVLSAQNLLIFACVGVRNM